MTSQDLQSWEPAVVHPSVNLSFIKNADGTYVAQNPSGITASTAAPTRAPEAPPT